MRAFLIYEIAGFTISFCILTPSVLNEKYYEYEVQCNLDLVTYNLMTNWNLVAILQNDFFLNSNILQD